MGGFRVVLTGKGGTGKTTLAAALALGFAASGRRVLAVDADAQSNLARALGLTLAETSSLVPLVRREEFVRERAGASGSDGASLLRLNPDVHDVVERFSVPAAASVRLLVMGSLMEVGTGCFCPEASLLTSVVRALPLSADEFVVMDTEAGVEHFGRALARGFQAAVVVTDATLNGVEAACEAARLARDLGISSTRLAVNRVRGAGDEAKAHRLLGERRRLFDAVDLIPWDGAVLDQEPSIAGLVGAPGLFAGAVAALAHGIEKSQ